MMIIMMSIMIMLTEFTHISGVHKVNQSPIGVRVPEFMMFAANEESTRGRECPAVGYKEIAEVAQAAGSSSSRGRRIVHLTMYDCEETILELKLAEMGPMLHKMVIGEGSMSNSNKPRRACFPDAVASSQIVRHYVDAGLIVHHYMDNQVEAFVYWEAEVHYRNQLSLPLKNMDLRDDDLVLLSDMDEIVARQHLAAMRDMESFPSESGLRIALRWTYYGFQWVNSGGWEINSVVTWDALRKKDRCDMKANAIRFDLCGTKGETWGIVGWHCSWCTTTRQFLRKIENSAHAPDMAAEMFKNEEFLEGQRERGLWFMTQTPNACYAGKNVTPPHSFSPRTAFSYAGET